MTADENDFDDPIANALLSDSTYERLQVERFRHFKQPLPTKLLWMSGLLVALALVFPVALAYPEFAPGVLGASPVFAAPRIALLGAVGGTVEVAAALVLVAVAVRRRQLEPSITESQAERLLNVEDVATLIGLGTGGASIALTDAFFLLGLAGPDAVAFFTADGNGPFLASGTDVTIGALALAAALAAVLVAALGLGLRRRLANR
jgi:hypothetical protein